MSAEQQYMEPVNPWALNASELDRLRERVRAAEKEAEKETDWTSKTRAEQHAESLARELRSAEFATKQVQGSRQQAARREVTGFVRSDDGGSYLEVQNAAVPEEPRQQYMPVAATNKSGQSWPQSFSERHALVKAALGELRQAGVA